MKIKKPGIEIFTDFMNIDIFTEIFISHLYHQVANVREYIVYGQTLLS